MLCCGVPARAVLRGRAGAAPAGREGLRMLRHPPPATSHCTSPPRVRPAPRIPRPPPTAAASRSAPLPCRGLPASETLLPRGSIRNPRSPSLTLCSDVSPHRGSPSPQNASRHPSVLRGNAAQPGSLRGWRWGGSHASCIVTLPVSGGFSRLSSATHHSSPRGGCPFHSKKIYNYLFLFG